MLCVERFSDGVAFSYRCCQTPFGELRNPVQCMKILFFCQNFESDQNLDFAVWVSRIYICQQHVFFEVLFLRGLFMISFYFRCVCEFAQG